MNDSRQGTRDRLLNAALTVVESAGVAGATSRQIATAAGTNLQAITYHFGSKDELVAQALVGAVRDWVEPARAALRGLADDPAGHLVRAVWELQTTLAEALPRVPAYIEALAMVPRSEPFRQQIRSLLGQLRAELADALPAAGRIPGLLDRPGTDGRPGAGSRRRHGDPPGPRSGRRGRRRRPRPGRAAAAGGLDHRARPVSRPAR
jgi:AcrR family transcriptional regulator